MAECSCTRRRVSAPRKERNPMAKKKAAKKAPKGAKKKATKKVAKKKAPKKAAKKAGGSKRRGGGAAFMRPVTPDDALGAVVGAEPKPRTEIAKRLWAYIRSKGLQ